MNDLMYLDGRVLSFAESEDHPDQYVGTILICDFGTNRNNVKLGREDAEACVATLVHAPFVGKVVSVRPGEFDFTGHNPRIKMISDSDGKMRPHYEFDTSAFGTFTSASIQEVDGEECIVADFVAWKRFERACDVLCRRVAEGTLSTSWEISYNTEDCQMIAEDGNPNPVKLINKWVFTGHCALGKNVSPAYDTSRVLNVAEEEDDEFASALISDVACAEESGKEDNALQNEEMAAVAGDHVAEEYVAPVTENATDLESAEQVEDVQAEAGAEDESGVAEATTSNEASEDCADTEDQESEELSEVEQSALTQRDLMRRLYRALEKELKDFWDIYAYFPEDHVVWCKVGGADELVVTVVQFSIDGEEIIINNTETMQLIAVPIELNNVASEQKHAIESMQSEIDALKPFKEQVEKQSRDIAEQKLRKRASAAKCFSEQELESDEFAEIFANLDANKLNEMIVDRTVSCEETAETVADTSVEMSDLRNAFEADPNPANGVRRWLGKR